MTPVGPSKAMLATSPVRCKRTFRARSTRGQPTGSIQSSLRKIVELRPVYHRKEQRIRSHVLLCWLALQRTEITVRQAAILRALDVPEPPRYAELPTPAVTASA